MWFLTTTTYIITCILQANMTTPTATGVLVSHREMTKAAHMSALMRNNTTNMRGHSIPVKKHCPMSAAPQPVYKVSAPQAD